MEKWRKDSWFGFIEAISYDSEDGLELNDSRAVFVLASVMKQFYNAAIHPIPPAFSLLFLCDEMNLLLLG